MPGFGFFNTVPRGTPPKGLQIYKVREKKPPLPTLSNTQIEPEAAATPESSELAESKSVRSESHSLSSEHSLAFFKSANELHKEQQLEELARHDLALKAEPHNVSLLDKRGLTLAILGRHEEALAAYQMALEAELNADKRPYLLLQCVFLLKGLGDYQEALAYCEEYQKIKPDDAKITQLYEEIKSKLEVPLAPDSGCGCVIL